MDNLRQGQEEKRGESMKKDYLQSLMNSSRAFEYFGSFICSSISSHTFCHFGFSLVSCSIGKDSVNQLFKTFDYKRGMKA